MTNEGLKTFFYNANKETEFRKLNEKSTRKALRRIATPFFYHVFILGKMLLITKNQPTISLNFGGQALGCRIDYHPKITLLISRKKICLFHF